MKLEQSQKTLKERVDELEAMQKSAMEAWKKSHDFTPRSAESPQGGNAAHRRLADVLRQLEAATEHAEAMEKRAREAELKLRGHVSRSNNRELDELKSRCEDLSQDLNYAQRDISRLREEKKHTMSRCATWMHCTQQMPNSVLRYQN